MRYYHGSQDDSLQELTTKHGKDSLVYVTSSRLVALTYAVRGYPNLFTTLKSGQEAFLEVVPNLFEKMIKGKDAYIYTLEEKAYQKVKQNNKCGHSDCFCYNDNIKVISKEYVKDAYQEFLRYIDQGDFVVVKPDDVPNRKQLIKTIISNASKVDFSNKENYLYLIKEK